MAEDSSDVKSPEPPQFLEVLCKSSGKNCRFASGTKAGFAVSLINRKVEVGTPLALHIEAVKEGEEPISFGPDAVLVNYGSGWKLQTVTEADFPGTRKREPVQPVPTETPIAKNFDGSRTKRDSETGLSFVYIGKILLAFVLMFILGAIFTWILENLPRVINVAITASS